VAIRKSFIRLLLVVIIAFKTVVFLKTGITVFKNLEQQINWLTDEAKH
jgi:cell division protein FtsB